MPEINGYEVCSQLEETLQLLRKYGVDFAQGYYIGRPRAASEAL